MTPVLLAIFTSLLWALPSSALLDDAACAVQTSKADGAVQTSAPHSQVITNATTGDDDEDEEEGPDMPTPRRMTPAPTFKIPLDPFFDEEDVDNDQTTAPSRPPPASSERRTSSEPRQEATDAGTVINLRGDTFGIFEPGDHTLLVIPRGSAADKSQLTVRARVDDIGTPCNGWLFLTRIELEGKWLDSIRQFVAWTNMDGENDVFRGIHFKVNYSTSRFGFNVSEFAENIPASVAKVQTFPGQIPKNVGDYVTTLIVTFKWRVSTSQVRMVYQKEVVGFSNSLWFTTTSLKDVKGEIGGILGADDHASSTRIPSQCLDKRRRNIARRAPPHRGTVHATAFLEPGNES